MCVLLAQSRIVKVNSWESNLQTLNHEYNADILQYDKLRSHILVCNMTTEYCKERKPSSNVLWYLWAHAVLWPVVDGNNDSLSNQPVHLPRLNTDLWNTSLRWNEHVIGCLQHQAKCECREPKL